jgi:hypothetical protein
MNCGGFTTVSTYPNSPSPSRRASAIARSLAVARHQADTTDTADTGLAETPGARVFCVGCVGCVATDSRYSSQPENVAQRPNGREFLGTLPPTDATDATGRGGVRLVAPSVLPHQVHTVRVEHVTALADRLHRDRRQHVEHRAQPVR